MHAMKPHLDHIDEQAVVEVWVHLRRPLALGEIDFAGAVAHAPVPVDGVPVEHMRVDLVVGNLHTRNVG